MSVEPNCVTFPVRALHILFVVSSWSCARIRQSQFLLSHAHDCDICHHHSVFLQYHVWTHNRFLSVNLFSPIDIVIIVESSLNFAIVFELKYSVDRKIRVRRIFYELSTAIFVMVMNILFCYHANQYKCGKWMPHFLKSFFCVWWCFLHVRSLLGSLKILYWLWCTIFWTMQAAWPKVAHGVQLHHNDWQPVLAASGGGERNAGSKVVRVDHARPGAHRQRHV